MQEVTLYQVYLDLRKAYDSIHRPRVMALLEKYGVGPRIRRYVETIWGDQVFFLRQSGFYSGGIRVGRGVTQGDTDSPIIFNLIVDVVLRCYSESGESTSSFYADDGLLENKDHITLQRDLDCVIELFGFFGLEANQGKTKFMVLWGPVAPVALSEAVYRQRYTGGLLWAAWSRQRVECPHCQKTVQQGSLRKHVETIHK